MLKRIKDKSNLSESPTKHTRSAREDKDSTEASNLERWKYEMTPSQISEVDVFLNKQL